VRQIFGDSRATARTPNAFGHLHSPRVRKDRFRRFAAVAFYFSDIYDLGFADPVPSNPFGTTHARSNLRTVPTRRYFGTLNIEIGGTVGRGRVIP